MKLIKRIKDILFDEEEVEIPVIEREKKSNIKEMLKKEDEVNNSDSITEIKMPEDDFSDKESLKSELTFPFPIEFDEEEVEKTKPIETVTRKETKPLRQVNYSSRYEVNNEKPKREIKDYSSYLKTKEEKKQFKPTPIISPVYGVLDQNYKKEDLVVKNEIKRKPISKDKLNLDEIRKRAYGDNSIDNTKELDVIDIDDIQIDPNKTIGELIDEESIKMPELDHNNIDEPMVELNDLIDEKENIEKKLQAENIIEEDDDTDLFSLIDSMYEENNE